MGLRRPNLTAYFFATVLVFLSVMSGIRSMTGFATAQGQTPLGFMTVELRGVNSRFLDLTLRLSDEFRATEPMVREVISSAVKRGKLECRASLKLADTSSSGINANALTNVLALQQEVLKLTPTATPMSVYDILQMPGILTTPEVDQDALNAAVAVVVGNALEAFNASREREGAALAAILSKNCDTIEEVVAAVAERIPDIHRNLKEKLEQRLQEALGTVLSGAGSISREEVSDRIRQEVTFYALKMDVTEEINRLRTHVAEVRRILEEGGAAGRRLDFVTQEMNREANTLGSKSAAIEMTDAAVALKLCIDQMREQLQNIE